ncbi:MAG: mobile mystery protein B [Gammaproteobacteria bacterium]|nr:mobile mystery protein B [Gammaproteobacteria bacterium]MBU0848440.1 mobile mystery protein B [Gammaproteobacteria bacterium]MBU1267674.1 mobile mystery protein B [Gammaproteobacteria bacterium]MBU1528197.1 mobile mystery protein B [Gammaproteobacteria bacterium]MBU1780351.1 mobile mystery protein B [Gammaproteobacteria bacterium]
MELTYQPGQTPLDPDEKEGLKPKHISTQSELNEWEQLNIIKGARWAQRQLKQDILDDVFLRKLHKRMFSDTWTWAGTYRKSDKNIGCDWRQVSTRVRNSLENTKYQVEHNAMPPDELAARFHHQLVLTHPFPNGNGRCCRLIADLPLQKMGLEPFTWGNGGHASLVSQSEMRAEYLAALRAADQSDISPLLAFARK